MTTEGPGGLYCRNIDLEELQVLVSRIESNDVEVPEDRLFE
jgi:hypothetical protein